MVDDFFIRQNRYESSLVVCEIISKDESHRKYKIINIYEKE